jgi:hypothetical protein
VNLEKGTPVYLIVSSFWYMQMAKAELLPKKNTTGDTLDMFAHILDASNLHGLWITPDDCITGWENLQVFVPWNYVISIAAHADFENFESKRREKAGFRFRR